MSASPQAWRRDRDGPAPVAPVGSAVIKMMERDKGLLVVARMFTSRTIELWAFLEAKTAKGAGLRRVYEHEMPEDEAYVLRTREA